MHTKRILDAVARACAAVKPQSACYEAYGWRGWRVLESTIEHAHSLGIPVILDAKRGDIGSTAIHYRQGLLTEAPGLDEGVTVPGLGVDWITASPFLGRDSVEPLIGSADEGKGAFILVRTSNPGAEDVQGTLVGDGVLISSSRAITGAWQSADADCEFAAAARDALDRMNDLLNAAMAAQATSGTVN